MRLRHISAKYGSASNRKRNSVTTIIGVEFRFRVRRATVTSWGQWVSKRHDAWKDHRIANHKHYIYGSLSLSAAVGPIFPKTASDRSHIVSRPLNRTRSVAGRDLDVCCRCRGAILATAAAQTTTWRPSRAGRRAKGRWIFDCSLCAWSRDPFRRRPPHPLPRSLVRHHGATGACPADRPTDRARHLERSKAAFLRRATLLTVAFDERKRGLIELFDRDAHAWMALGIGTDLLPAAGCIASGRAYRLTDGRADGGRAQDGRVNT